MNVKAILEAILDKKREAEAHGWKLDLLVFPLAYKDDLFKAVVTEAYAGEAYTLGSEKDGFPIYLHGIKVLWSGARLPHGQVWFRYRGEGGAAAVASK